MDPLETAASAPAAGAALEWVTGTVHELLIEDQVAGATVRYRSLRSSDGSALTLSGDAASALVQGSRVELSGRRNGKTLFVERTRIVAGASLAPKARALASAEGELKLFYIDRFEINESEIGFEVVAADGQVTPLALPVRPEALQRGMQVRVTGARAADGSVEPELIVITALPAATPAAAAMVTKAAVTNNVLVILIRFADSAAAPFTQAQVQAIISGGVGSGSVTDYFRETSYGSQLLSATVTPWLVTTSATPANCDWRTMGSLARTAATNAGYPTSSYQNLVYVFPRVSACGWAGLGYIGASGSWINGYNQTKIYGHELGHNFGLLHAASLDCGGAVIGGTCHASEYGDPFGMMGSASAMQFNAAQKLDLGWIGSTTVKTHAPGITTYVLSPLETSGGGTYAVKIPAATKRTYWLEYRQPIGFDGSLGSYPNNGAQVRVTAPFETLCPSCDSYSNDTELLDMTPATGSFYDSALVVGQTFTDPNYGIIISVLDATASTLTLQVSSPGAGTATTTLLVSSLNPSVAGNSVTFTATVTGNAPTGTVAFTDNGGAMAGCTAVTLSGTGGSRTAACTTSALAGGIAHSIVARYGGDIGNLTSTSLAVAQTVSAVPVVPGSNVALASLGGVATASSVTSPGYAVASVNDGEHAGINWGLDGGWRDATANVYPDWVQITFASSRTIDRVVVYSVQDNFGSPVEPTDAMTFSLYGIQDFTVQGWNGSAWVTLGTVTGNTLVKRTVTFSDFATDRIRVNVTRALGSFSRIPEIEAFVPGATAVTPSSTAVQSSAPSATVGATVTFTATVTGASPTGQVAFTDNGVGLTGCGSVALTASGTATCASSTLAEGNHAIVASYGGDANNTASTSASLAQVINPVPVNVALASASGVATASSGNTADYPLASVNNGERAGVNWSLGGGWRDATGNAYPDWVQIAFSGSRTIDSVVVYTVQDNYTSPVEPTDAMTFSLYGIQDFTVQGWNGSAWVTLGTVSGNSLVKRTVTFSAFTTDRIRVNVTRALASFSRVTEIEAWTVPAAAVGATPGEAFTEAKGADRRGRRMTTR